MVESIISTYYWHLLLLCCLFGTVFVYDSGSGCASSLGTSVEAFNIETESTPDVPLLHNLRTIVRNHMVLV